MVEEVSWHILLSGDQHVPGGKVQSFLIYFFVNLFIFFFESGFLCVALAVRQLTLSISLALKSEVLWPLPPECWY